MFKTSCVASSYEFLLWPQNKATKQTTISAEELAAKYDAWLKKQDRPYLDRIGSHTAIRYFITGDDGLNSTFQEKEFPILRDLLSPYFDARV